MDVIEIDNQHYIPARSAMADDRTRVLKHDETFAVFDRYGDIQPIGRGEQGLYHEGTRYLSKLILHVWGKRPLLLSSTIRDDNVLLAIDLTNPDIFTRAGHLLLPRGTVHLYRTRFLWDGRCYERLVARNYGLMPAEVPISIRVHGDFADIFEVRGEKRQKRGERLETVPSRNAVALAYRGLDGVVRRVRLVADPFPQDLSEGEIRFDTHLEVGEEKEFFLTTHCEPETAAAAETLSYGEALGRANRALHSTDRAKCSVKTSNRQFNQWVNRSAADLRMLTSSTPSGLYPYAGIPWYSTQFGRDGIITALEYLWLDPAMTRGVLAYLAETQAIETIPDMDAEPGKILHEARRGEMAALGEVPFGRYYGSVDATPLFVLLAAAYHERTGDTDFIRSIWPNIEAALDWIERYGDADGDGFIEYSRHSRSGLLQQGWKDSSDSIFHADGDLAEAPIAVCEAQAYVFAAKNGIAEVAAALGDAGRADALESEARALQERFERDFWCEDLGTYALALDGRKRPCRVRSSNAGHCLFAGISTPERAARVAETLLHRDSFSGWGIRTVAASESRYNPMSYHNGSVWPHDNALVASGFARYNLKSAAARVLEGLLEAAVFVELHRVPELFCGFTRRKGKGPTLYPVACAPQAWAAGSVFMLLGACLGISIDARRRRVAFHQPYLPASLDRVEIRNLKVQDAALDLAITGSAETVGVEVLREEGEVEVVTFG